MKNLTYLLAAFALILSTPSLSFAQANEMGTALPPQPSIVAAEEDETVAVTMGNEQSPYMSTENTHPPIKMTPDKSTLISLPAAVKSLVIGNPAHLSVLVDTPQLLVLIGKQPGATYFSALDATGNIIMQRHVIVASPKEDYVRIRRSCANADADSECSATSVYYCPDICHEVAIVTEDGVEASTE